MAYSSVSKFVVRALVVLCFGVIGGVLAEASAPGQEAPVTRQAPQDCATCHINIVAAWQTSTHAQAYADPVFQEKWQQGGSKTECLACHTTGYVAFSGEYAAEGVTCEACHGLTPANHPTEPVAIDRSAEVCATCHATTYNEWKISKHGEQQLACTTCHNPHPQALRFESVNALCLNCHKEGARTDYAHLVHAALECTDCHWHRGREEDLLAHYESGNLYPSGHSGAVETAACVDCHAQISELGLVEGGAQIAEELGLTSAHPLHEAQVRIRELESEVDTLKAQGANSSALRLAQGAVLGIAIGGVAVFGVTRFRRRSSGVRPMKEG